MTTGIEIPSLPVAQIRAMSLISNPSPSFEDLASIVDADPALTAALLRAANSASSSPIDPVHTSRIAMVRIGAVETRRMVMRIALSNSFGSLADSHIDETELWRHLIATGILADATAWGEVRHSEAFTAGLLHDLGHLAMAAQDPVRYAKVVDLARRGIPAMDAERTLFGMNHAQWGESIGRSWGFPADIVDAIGEHHTGAQHGLSWVVTRARELVASLGIGDGLPPPSRPIQTAKPRCSRSSRSSAARAQSSNAWTGTAARPARRSANRYDSRPQRPQRSRSAASTAAIPSIASKRTRPRRAESPVSSRGGSPRRARNPSSPQRMMMLWFHANTGPASGDSRFIHARLVPTSHS